MNTQSLIVTQDKNINFLPELFLPPCQVPPVSYLHLNYLTDLLNLLILQVLLHHQGLVSLGIDVTIPESYNMYSD